ncbi:hypothetical protein FRC08_015475 [Ceratobasidium sp. 394]|nr:hypothetical protein FRC08_015475 [Ceratobasidium sp. 394]
MGAAIFGRIVLALGLVVISTNAACTKTYSVVGGDTCISIPQKNSISSYQLTKLNPSLNCNALSVGQSLCVMDSTYNCQPVYTVKSGDSCFNIASTNGIDTNQLINNNPQLGNSCAIQPGQNLCVAKPSTTTKPGNYNGHELSSSYFYSYMHEDLHRQIWRQAIASSNSISYYQLTYLNPTMSCTALSIGRSLCITASQYNCQPVYTVKSGDTCSAIAAANSITVDQIITNNPNLGSSCAISVGLTICIKSGATATTATTSSAAPTSTACTRLTTVRSGDTCDTIGARAGISRYWLGVLNPTINAACSNIQGGQALCVDSAQHNCGSVYQITGKEGGCQGVADSLKLTVPGMVSLNPNINSGCTNIYVNEVICTTPRPAGTPSTACTRNYAIVPGDTCNNIAAKNSLTSLQLQSINPSLNCNTLGVGNTLCSFSPSLSICPKLLQVVANDTCYGLATAVQMSVDEWKSINQGVNCDALQLSSLVCSAQGNATLPQVPSGTNPTALPLCGKYDKKKRCCTMYSSTADLFNSPLCLRANGCQENCIGDSGVVKPTTSDTPTYTIGPTIAPDPTPTANCNNCTSTQCCTSFDVCMDQTAWYCKAANGCKKNCDTYNSTTVLFPGSYYDSPKYSFPLGNFSQYGGNPCGACNAMNSLGTSAKGQYCCAYGGRCMPQEAESCKVWNGCLYNCIDQTLDSTAYDKCEGSGVCVYSTITVLQPWASATPLP